MNTRNLAGIAVVLWIVALPGASAVGDEVHAALDQTMELTGALLTTTTDLVFGAVVFEDDASSESEEDPAASEASDAPAPEPAPSSSSSDPYSSSLLPAPVAPVTGLVPVPVVGNGATPRIDLSALNAVATSVVPLLASDASAAGGMRVSKAPPAPAAVELASAAASAADIAPVPLALAAVTAVAAGAGATPTASALWERLRRLGWLALLYSRIAKERLLDHGSRERLLMTIRERPGLAVADLAAASGMPRNTVTYHLRVLEREHLVSSTRNGRNRLFFAPGSLPQRANADAIATLRHATTLAMAQAIGATPGVDQKSLCERVGVSPSLAHWHADRLVASGVVDRRREGRFVRYYPGASFDVVAARSA